MQITSLAEMFPSLDEASTQLLHRCASFMMKNVLTDLTAISRFTAKCCEEGTSTAALKLISTIKDVQTRTSKIGTENEIAPRLPGNIATNYQQVQPRRQPKPAQRHSKLISEHFPTFQSKQQKVFKSVYFFLTCVFVLAFLVVFSILIYFVVYIYMQ